MTTWLLADETVRELSAYARNMRLSPETLAVAQAQQRGRSATRADAGVLEVQVEGVLTKGFHPLLSLFTATTSYESIRDALAVAAQDSSVRSVQMLVDSPGGQVDGLFETLAAIQAVNKPFTVRAANAQSAAYALAAVAGKVEATNAAAKFGSVGVAADLLLEPEVVSISSSSAPDKRPDLGTDEGRAVVRRYLDAVEDLFVDAIAKGRGVTTSTVRDRFGRGATLLAGDAKARGMIDSISSGYSFTRSSSAAAATAAATDYGDQVAEVMRARREGRQPAAWARGGADVREPYATASDARSTVGDLGDQAAAIMLARRGRKLV